MHPKKPLLLLIIALGMLQPGLHPASGDSLAVEVTLFAHTDPSATSVGGRVLTLGAKSTTRQAADVRDDIAFTLVPPLSAPLRILGPISAYVWLLSQSSVRGTLRVAVSEVIANASVIEIRSRSATLELPPTPRMVLFGFGVNHTLATGSALRLEVQFSPVESIPVSLLWDDPSTPTRLILQIESYPKVGLTITDSSGRASTIFAHNETGMAQLKAKVSIEDPFGGMNVCVVSLRVTNSSGYTLVKDTPMSLTSAAKCPLQLEYLLTIALPAGRFDVTASVQDCAQRTFVVTRKVMVTPFYTLFLLLTDVQERPLSGLNVSLSAAGQWIEEVKTESDGTAVSLVPSSRAVGSITVQIRKFGIDVLSREIEVESDSMIQLEVPLYDWTFLVRLQNVNLAISRARVELYLNETFLTSNSTDGNGLAVFTSMPPGTYDITVASPFASTHFNNVSHAPEPEKTLLEIPPPLVISNNGILLAAAIAIIASIGVVAAVRRRPGTHRFKHVADLLGGVLPSSSVIMIAGPSGSGKSLLLQNILSDSLRLRRRCVYVSNSQIPSRIKEQLAKMGLDTDRYQNDDMLRFIDAYSGGSGVVSSEKHSISSPRDLTALGVQVTSCLDEVGGVGDVFLDSLAPFVALGDLTQALNFVEYYGARIVKSGGNFLYVASDAIKSDLLKQFEELSDCVLWIERYVGSGKARSRLLVKKARGIEHEQGWIGLKITSSGCIELVSLPAESV